MKVSILAVGRAKPGPERALTDAYRARFDALGRGMGFGALDIAEIDAKNAGREAESARLLDRLPPGHALVALDERGGTMDSRAFSALLARTRDDGAPGIAFAIGGADGHADAVRDRAGRLLSFGRMTWPHMLVRAMLAEQLYRALAIAANHPYHRG